MRRIGITGIGGYGRILLEILLEEQALGNIKLVIAVVAFPEQDAEHVNHLRQQSPHTEIYPSIDDVIKAGAGLDLMVLPVGIGSHKVLTLKSLAAGWNVLVEKPLAGSLEDAEAIIDAEKASDCFVAVGYQDMYNDYTSEIKNRILSGDIGHIEEVRVLGIWGRPVEYYERSPWAGKLIHDGQSVFDSPFNNALAHFLNMAMYFAGHKQSHPAIPVSAQGQLYRTHDIQSCDTAFITWQTDSAVQVKGFFSHASSDYIGPIVLIVGDKGVIRWELEKDWSLDTEESKAESFSVPPLAEIRHEMMRRVIRRLDDTSVAVFSASDALAQVKAVSLAHEMPEIKPINSITSMSEDDAGNFLHWKEVSGIRQHGIEFLEGGELPENFLDTYEFK